MYIKDSSGNESLTATMAIISFAVVMIKVLLSGASVALGTTTFSFGTIDSLSIAAIFTPILGTYMARRWGSQPAGIVLPIANDAGSKSNDGGA